MSYAAGRVWSGRYTGCLRGNWDAADGSGTAAPAMVLVVDDDVELRGSIVDCLSEDYAVLGAENADAAVALLAKTCVDFVVSDVRMPGTMDGFGLAAWLRANRPGTPVLMITGYSERTTPDHPDDPPLWHKPFAFGQLLEYIKRVLH